MYIFLPGLQTVADGNILITFDIMIQCKSKVQQICRCEICWLRSHISNAMGLCGFICCLALQQNVPGKDYII